MHERCSDLLFPPASIARAAHRAAMSVVDPHSLLGAPCGAAKSTWRAQLATRASRSAGPRPRALRPPTRNRCGRVFMKAMQPELGGAGLNAICSNRHQSRPPRSASRSLRSSRPGPVCTPEKCYNRDVSVVAQRTPPHTNTHTHALTSVNACSTLSVLSLSKC